jgi:hypothetical protein
MPVTKSFVRRLLRIPIVFLAQIDFSIHDRISNEVRALHSLASSKIAFVQTVARERSMQGEIAGTSVADANAAEAVKVPKGILVDTVTGGDGCGAEPGWRPRWSAFPFGTYRSGAGLGPAVVWKKMSSMFQRAT